MLTSVLVRLMLQSSSRSCRLSYERYCEPKAEALDMLNRIIKIYQGKD
jgi:hypothetical protein